VSRPVPVVSASVPVDDPAASLIRASDLRKSFGELEAVRGIDLDVRRGEAFGFLGPNGAGKS
jgi:lipooligosaccharide transport system ATP-binding protein